MFKPSVVGTALLATIAACGGRPSAGGAQDGHMGSVAATGPAPTIEVGGGDPNGTPAFRVKGLPAVAADGSRVAIAVDDQGGAGDRLNLKLDVIDRADHVGREIVIVDPAHADADSAPHVTDANAYLSTTNAASAWTPLTMLEVQDGSHLSSDPPKTGTLATDGIEVTYLDGHVTVAVAGARVVDKDVPGWKAPPGEVIGDVQCANSSYLAGAAFDVAHKLVLIEINYTGTDSCWEPAPSHHVVTW